MRHGQMLAPATVGLLIGSEVENRDLAIGVWVTAHELARDGEGAAVEDADWTPVDGVGTARRRAKKLEDRKGQ